MGFLIGFAIGYYWESRIKNFCIKTLRALRKALKEAID